MSLLSEAEAEREFGLGRKDLEKDNFEAALTHFHTALELQDNPCLYSYVGYCIAKVYGDIIMGAQLCLESLAIESENAIHYLNLGRIYLAAGYKKKALLTFRNGLAKEENEEILRLLDEFGPRNSPVIKFLPRSNPLNKFLGNFLYRHNMRKCNVE